MQTSGLHPVQPTRFSRNEKWVLCLLTLTGAVIRFVFLYGRSFTGDEIGTLIFLDKDVTYLLSHFATWLSMNYYIVAEKYIALLFGNGPLSLGFLSLVAGIATIPLTALLAVRFSSTSIALVAAALVSINPYLIQFSGIIRSYALLTAFATLMMILFFRWQEEQSWLRGALVALVAFIMILAHLNGVYPVAYVGFILFLGLLKVQDRPSYLKSLPTLLLPLALAGVCLYLAYYRIFPEMFAATGEIIHDTPPTSISYIPYSFSEYFTGGFYGWPVAGLFLVGILFAFKDGHPACVLLPALFLPVLLASIQGTSHFPWAYSRFLIFMLPVIIIFVALGIEQLVTRFFPAAPWLATCGMAFILAVLLIPRLAVVFDEKIGFPWRTVATFLKQNCKEGDLIVGSDWIVPFHLRQYHPETQGRLLGFPQGVKRLTESPARSGKVYYVTYAYKPSRLAASILPASDLVKTKHEVLLFGKIQVVVYQVTPGAIPLQALRADLVNTVGQGKELAAEFATKYRNIWDIDTVLDPEGEKVRYYDLWMKCASLDDRQRYSPRAFLIWETKQALKSWR